jgi:autotransporter-associated beta strand protein
VTTVLYEEEGCTSNAAFVMRGNATIDASGTGALVLTGNITHELDCERTLTLTGSNQGNNELSGAIQSGGGGTSVFKTGVGLWRLSGNSGYTGRLSVLDGTLVMGTSVGSSGESPFGAEDSPEPIIGNSAAGATGTALLLVAAGNSIERGFSVAALDGGGANQVVVLGATGTGSGQIGTNSASIRLNRPAITLQAADTATAVFVGNWRDGSGNANPTVAYTIGTLGNAGVVVLESVLSGSATSVNIVNGTARLQVSIDDGINSATPVTIGSGLGAAIFDINGQSQTLSDIAFVVGSGSITSGTLRLTGTVAATGTGHTISSAVALDAAVTFSGSGELTISGVVSGSESLTYSGDGTLTLSGANTYTGGTTINYGTATAGSLTAFGTGSITVNAGGTLNKGGFALANSITNNGGTVIN